MISMVIKASSLAVIIAAFLVVATLAWIGLSPSSGVVAGDSIECDVELVETGYMEKGVVNEACNTEDVE